MNEFTRNMLIFLSRNRSRIVGLVVLVILIPLTILGVIKLQQPKGNAPYPPALAGTATAGPASTNAGSRIMRHYGYVYDMAKGHELVKTIRLPTTAGVRGVFASPITHMLYISYGGDGGSNGNGSLLKYDLVADQLVGDSGGVIDTATRKSVIILPTLSNTRKMLEIDWQNGVPIFTTSRSGLGYVTNPGSSTSTSTSNPTISTFPTDTVTPNFIAFQPADISIPTLFSLSASDILATEPCRSIYNGRREEHAVHQAPDPLADGTTCDNFKPLQIAHLGASNVKGSTCGTSQCFRL